MSGARLDLEGVTKHFRGLRAVHDVSFTVPAGAIHALIGPNGAGKTTIFNMIAGVFAPNGGAVRIDGKAISGLRPDLICDAGRVREQIRELHSRLARRSEFER